MSIAVVGPEKYDFQDRVCVDLGLRFRDHPDAILVAEPHLGEDAQVAWKDGDKTYTLEVQVKGSKDDFSLDRLIDYLAHFPDEEAADTLIERLLRNDSRLALFVVTGRADDRIAPHLVGAGWRGQLERILPPRALGVLAKDVIAGLPTASVGPIKANRPTALQAARQAHLKTLSKLLPKDVKAALARVYVTDRLGDAEIDVRLQATLRSEWSVASDRMQDTVAALKAVIFSGKRSKEDLLPRLADVLARYAPAPLAPASYVERGLEGQLAERLAADRAVLIAGEPRTGKSWLALTLAGRLQALGFEVQQGAYVQEAERFLLDPSRVERAYVLEDPLGARLVRDDAARTLADLRSLLQRLPAHRRLIVAQSQAPLLQASGMETVAECRVGARSWTAIPAPDTATAMTIWRQAAIDQGLDNDAINYVGAAIMRRVDLRDPGALTFLAQTYGAVGVAPSDEALVLASRRDASDLAALLVNDIAAVRDVMVALAVSTEPAVAVSERELAYILDGQDDRPGRSARDFRIYSIGGSEQKETKAPDYHAAVALSDDQHLALDTLHRRRVIEGPPGLSQFVHPYGQAAAQGLVRPPLARETPQALARIDRALACLEPRNALAAARGLDWMMLVLDGRPGGPQGVLDAAEKGLQSIFPAVRDACYAFLMARAADLPEDRLERIPRWIGLVDVSIDEIEQRGELFIIDEDGDSMRRHFETVALERVSAYLSAIEDGVPLDLDILRSREILRALAAKPSAMTLTLLRRMLSADESLVRAEAVKVWLALPREADDDVLERLARDVSPHLALVVLKQLGRTWAKLSPERREALLAVLQAQAVSPGAAIVVLGKLAVFERVEHFGKDPPWELFTRIAPIAMRHLPPSVDVDDGRLRNAVIHAVANGVGSALEPTLRAWSERLLARLVEYLPGEMELSVVEMMARALQPDERRDLLARLLDGPSTGATLVFLLDLMKHWDKLDAAERDLVVARLDERYADAPWTRALVLTYVDPPPALLEAALQGRASPDDLAQATALLTPEEMAACVRTYAGDPSILAGLGLRGGGAPAWSQILDDLARQPAHPLWRPAFAYLMNRVDDDLLTAVIAEVEDSGLDAIFEVMLAHRVREVGYWRRAPWLALLAKGETAGRLDDWFAAIDAALPASIEHLRDIKHWFGTSAYVPRILDLITNDLLLLQRLDNALLVMEHLKERLDASDEGEDSPAASLPLDRISELEAAWRKRLAEQLAQSPPRLWNTLGSAHDAFKALGADKAELEALEEQRRAMVDAAHRLRDSFRLAEDKALLTGWIGSR